MQSVLLPMSNSPVHYCQSGKRTNIIIHFSRIHFTSGCLLLNAIDTRMLLLVYSEKVKIDLKKC